MTMFQQMKRLIAGKPATRRRRKSDSNPVASLERLEDRQLLTTLSGLPNAGREVYGDFDGNGTMDRANAGYLVDVEYTFFESGQTFGERTPYFVEQRIDAGDLGVGFAGAKSLAVADFNRDGFDDLAVGAFSQDVGGETDAGAVYVLFGSSEGLTTDGYLSINREAFGADPEKDDQFGYRLAVGDFNPDGWADLVIAAPNVGPDNEGSVFVVYGNEAVGGLSDEGFQEWRENANGVGGEGRLDYGDRFGETLTVADFNHDGADDIAIGAPGQAVRGWAGPGVVQVLYGGLDGLSANDNEYIRQDSHGIGESTDRLDAFGSTLASGDLNGDGYDDLIVGVPNEDYDGQEDAGVIHVIYGREGVNQWDRVDVLRNSRNQIINRETTGVIGNAEENDRFGEILITGDFNNDGRDELVVGLPNTDEFGRQNVGQVIVFSASQDGMIDRNEVWDSRRLGLNRSSFGYDLRTGDYNFDGKLDLQINRDIILYGSSNGLSQTAPEMFDGVLLGLADPNALFAPVTVSTDTNGWTQATINASDAGDDVRVTLDGGFLKIVGDYGGQAYGRRYGVGYIDEIVFHGGAGDDVFVNDSDVPLIAFGYDGHDRIIGGSANDRINGGYGNDTIIGNDGRDDLFGSYDHDYLDGGTGDDVMNGWYGNDTLYGGIGFDSLRGDRGFDYLSGGEDDDYLNGGGETDQIYGDDGHDHLFGGTGPDRLYGGEGDDYVDGYDGDDWVYGNGGHDRLLGGHGDDHLEGGTGNDVLFGYYGDDTIYGGEGNDELHGEDGNDLMDGGAGDDWMQGWDGHDTLFGSAGNDWIDGWWGNDSIFGGSGNDVLHGGGGDDLIKGEQGNDEIRGWGGNDRLYGGIGNDWIDGWDGHDQIFGEENNDTLHGGTGDDTISGGGGDDWADGWTGNDRVRGGAGNDVLHGGTGNDIMDGEDGHDQVIGWQGNDTIEGGRGDDYLDGHDGDDVIRGEDGHDRILGGNGHDFLNGGEGNDTLFGWFGNDTMFGEAGNDFLYGEDGYDRMWGGIGNDRLEGGNHNDSLYGDDGYDVLLGGNGNDYMDGGRDYYHDYIHGGLGYDTIAYHHGFHWDYAYNWERVYRYTPWGTFVDYA